MKVSPFSSGKKQLLKNPNNSTNNSEYSKNSRKISPAANPISKNTKNLNPSPENSKIKPAQKEKYINNTFSDDNPFHLSDHSIPENAIEDDKSTKVELKRAYEDYIEVLQKSNKDSIIILNDMKQLIEEGIEAQSVSFLNNKIKREISKLKENIKKAKANYNYSNEQRNTLVSINVDKAAPLDISNAVFEMQMENSLLNQTCSNLEIDIDELNSRILDLQQDIASSNDQLKKKSQSSEDKIIQSKIKQFKSSLEQIKLIKTPSIQNEVNSEVDYDNVRIDSSLTKARGLNSMMRRYAYRVQSNFLDKISKFEDISEKCSIIWPKLNGFKPDEILMEQFMNEMWEQAALNDQIQTLQFHLDNILRSSGISITDDSLSGLVHSLKSALQM